MAGIFAAKGRPAFNPLIVHVADLAAAEGLAVLPAAARALAGRFWPGPLTLVLPRRAGAGLAERATAGLPSVALRVPQHPLAQRLLAAFGGPLAAPSANPSGPGQRDDRGARPRRARRPHRRRPRRRRLPARARIDHRRLRGRMRRCCSVPAGCRSRRSPRPSAARSARPPTVGITAPGQLASHYAPERGASARCGGAGPGRGLARLRARRGRRGPGLNLSPSGDLAEAAANLFAHLRALDALAERVGASGIAVARVPRAGLGLALNDRLARAAAPRS